MDLRQQPTTSDGKQIMLPNLFPGGVTLYYAGSGDHATNGRGEGTLFQKGSTAQEDATVEWQFNDWVYVAGADVVYSGAVLGDWLTLEVFAPATSVAVNESNEGDCNVVDGVIVPAAGNGGYDVTLATAVPVPAFVEESDSPTGYWDWDEPNEGKGTITASATPGSARWHLIAANLYLARFACKKPMLGTTFENIVVPAIKPKKILPQWKWKLTMHNSTTKSLDLGWTLVTARSTTL